MTSAIWCGGGAAAQNVATLEPTYPAVFQKFYTSVAEEAEASF